MLLKEILQSINLDENDSIFVFYKNLRDKYIINIKSCDWKHYYECDVNSYKVYDNVRWLDPISNISGFCKQYSIEIDCHEAKIVKSRIYK